MEGYMGKALLVDLGGNSIESRDLPQEWYDDFIGGEGLAIRLFHEYMDPEREALDPESPMLFATGPLNATKAPACWPDGGGLSFSGHGYIRTQQRGRPFRPGAEKGRLGHFAG